MTDSHPAPTKQRLEFGGTPGNVSLILGLPLVTLYLYFALRYNGARLLPGPESEWAAFGQSLVPTWRAAGIYAGWLVLQAGLQAFLPGRRVRGVALPDGGRLEYRMNGLLSLTVTFIVAATLHTSGVLPLQTLYHEFGALLTVMTLFVVGFSVFLYFYGLRADPAANRSGKVIHDFWMGTGHNPRVPPRGAFDLKLFCEARPGLIFWMMLNASFALVQYQRYGFVSTAMGLVLGMQLLYIIDYFWHESAILSTMDIRHERFGYMLAFGDLVWVPMTYSLQAHYLIHHVDDLPLVAAVAIAALNLVGYAIFRTVNLQKHRFRADPDGARIWGRPAEYLETQAGSKLLVSGFWGWSRHFNYVGDILMAVSWSLPCLFDSLVPWFYPIYFTILLLHRERRDHRLCSAKYGADWDRYCKKVPYRIVPGIY
jgi:hypothetical protein